MKTSAQQLDSSCATQACLLAPPRLYASVAVAAKKLGRFVFAYMLPLAFHFAGHRRLLRLLSSTEIAILRKQQPRLQYKYLDGNYLAESLSVRTRLAILTHHYTFLHQRVAADFFSQLIDASPMLWNTSLEEQQFSIRLSFPQSPHHAGRAADHEGDLALTFHAGDVPLYVVCFTIANSNLLHAGEQHVRDAPLLFIGRIQGADGRYESIRQATKNLHDVSPRDMLFAAIAGLSSALGIASVIGVSTDEQLSKPSDTQSDEPFFNYDKFWDSLGAQRTNDRLYVLPLPLQEKPSELITQKHRARTLRKRRFKEGIAHHVEQYFTAQFLQNRIPMEGRIRNPANLQQTVPHLKPAATH